MALPPRTRMVTAREFAHSSITNILSLVVPKDSSRTKPAVPNLSAVSSSNLGTIRPPVAIAISSISGPPTYYILHQYIPAYYIIILLCFTHRTAGSCCCRSK